MYQKQSILSKLQANCRELQQLKAVASQVRRDLLEVDDIAISARQLEEELKAAGHSRSLTEVQEELRSIAADRYAKAEPVQILDNRLTCADHLFCSARLLWTANASIKRDKSCRVTKTLFKYAEATQKPHLIRNVWLMPKLGKELHNRMKLGSG